MNKKYPIKFFSPNTKNTIWILAYVCDKCNYNCWYCYNKRPRSGKQLDLDKLHDFIVYLKNDTEKTINLELIGGEPTMHKGLYDFCKNTIQDGISINIYTNFSQSVEFYQELLDIGCQLSITYHHFNNKNFLNKIDNLGNDDQKNQFDIAIMYEPGYSMQSLNVFNYLYQKRKYRKNILMSLVLSDTSNKIPVKYTQDEMSKFNKYVELTRNNLDEIYVKYNDNSVKKMSYNDLQLDYDYSCKNWKCNAGIEYLDIDVNGNVYSCISNNKKIYNIYDSFKFKLPEKPIICRCMYCQCRWNITKERIFK